MLERIWMEEKLQNCWKKGLIVKLPKKRDTTNCNTWKGITLLSVPSKILSRIILNHIKDAVETCLQKKHESFWNRRCYINLINTLQIILVQSVVWQSTLYLTWFCEGHRFPKQKGYVANPGRIWYTQEKYHQRNVWGLQMSCATWVKSKQIEVSSGVQKKCKQPPPNSVPEHSGKRKEERYSTGIAQKAWTP
jgi:hypothetical protein